MDLLEVKNISKTYGTGEATVHALKQAPFPFQKENSSQSLVNLVLVRVRS